MPNTETPTELRDTPVSYGYVSRFFHWALAALILWQLLGMVMKFALGRHPVSAFFVGTHQWVGSVIFVLVVLRVVWAVSNAGRRPPHEAGLMGFASRAGHGLLYLLMLVIPALALLRAWGSERAFAPLGLEIFSAREADIAWAVAPANAAHGTLGWVFLAVIAGHVAMAFYHQKVLRDRALNRMA
ncbi:cytochrome b [Allosediminivita pacifica]|uniref:Cytochrome b561 n=1 Tax=Allosediminivita pacifica TaxID=1267769 RepID=A0A2T6ANN4_9RHOB|nr:cytochrome b [Allosediminivita pacifica]PTX45407.1 cytochrome b561 [Allosediminivita pacifica]GGB21063.1 hypothetical protein GCM10011324_33880 [Allosediminivita pacifica]